ncbi:MAG: hypothetical protein QG620_31 [Patescibacteria group bacterium]|nr:hypothetical protein [Patescibacteria group bacterium]
MKKQTLIPIESIQQKIYFIRGEKVMFDRDLAVLYGVTTGNLNKAVKRNIKRFPFDFMFQLNKKEAGVFSRFQIGSLNDGESSRSQIVTLKRGYNIKYAPYVFTEQGIAMLSSVLNSERAIQVNIQIMRIFTSLRKMLMTHKELKTKIEAMEKKYDKKFAIVFETIKLLLKEDAKPKKQIGFKCG